MSRREAGPSSAAGTGIAPRLVAISASLLLLLWLYRLDHSLPSALRVRIANPAVLRSSWFFSPLGALVSRTLHGSAYSQVLLLAMAVVAHGALLLWLALFSYRIDRTRPQAISVWLFAFAALAILVTPAAMHMLDKGTMDAAALLTGTAGAGLIRRLTRSPRLPPLLLTAVFLWGIACVLVRTDLLFATVAVSIATGLEIFAGRSRRMAVEHPKLGIVAAVLPVFGGMAGVITLLLGNFWRLSGASFADSASALRSTVLDVHLFQALVFFFVAVSCVALLVFDGMRPADTAINFLLLGAFLPWGSLPLDAGVQTPAWTLGLPLCWNLLRLSELDSWRNAALAPAFWVVLGTVLLALLALSFAGIRPSAAVLSL